MVKKIIFVLFILVFVGVLVGAGEERIIDEKIGYSFDSGSEKVLVLVEEETRGWFGKKGIKEEVLNLSENEWEKKVNSGKIKKAEIVFPIKAKLQDSIGLISADSAWNLQSGGINLSGNQTSVCILDSGINNSHPDFAGKILAEKCFCSGCCPDGSSEDDNASDDNGHGTHVAGIVAANGGIGGVGRDVNLVIVKVLDSAGNGLSIDLASGIDWCVNNSEEYNISVISASIGTDCLDTPEFCYNDYCDGVDSTTSSIDEAYDQNISFIVATGNENNATHISWPACVSNSIRVSSSTDADVISSFSNRNWMVKLLAPGTNINSTSYSGNYEVSSGTSMSTPHVAGAFAIVNQLLSLTGRLMTPSAIETAFFSTGVNITDSQNSSQNFSRIDLYSALLSLDNASPNVTLVSPVDSTVSLDENQTFICNATDWQLANATFYLWNSSSLYYNETKNVSGTGNQTSFNVTNLSVENYVWNCQFSDAVGNNALATNNLTLVIGGVSVELSPSNNTYTNQSETNFSCTSRTDSRYDLSNVTFSLWNLTSLLYNETTPISGTTNESIFNYSFVNETEYIWGCEAFNNVSNSSATNYTMTYDATTPNLTILSESVTTTTATITWNTSEETNYSFSIGDNINNSFAYGGSVSLSGLDQNTAYSYNITFCDRANNCNVSEDSFQTQAQPVIGSSGGGGGGGGGATTSTYTITPEELGGGGSSKSLSKKGDKIKFGTIGGGNHTLTLNEIKDNEVNITIRSDPIEIILGEGKSTKINLSSPDYFDLYIKVEDIRFGRANITLKSINESIYKPVKGLGDNEGGGVLPEGGDGGADENDEDYELIVSVTVIWLILIFIILRITNWKKIKTMKAPQNNEKDKKSKVKTERKR